MSARTDQVLMIAGVVAGLIGVVLTVQSVRATPAALAQLQRRADDYARIQALGADAERARAVLRARAELGRDRAVPVDDLVMSAFPGLSPQVQPRDVRPVADGWLVRSVEVVLDDAPLSGVGKLSVEGAALRPPWRIAEVSITASDRPGHGRVSLLLEAIERGSRVEGRGANLDSTPDPRPSTL